MQHPYNSIQLTAASADQVYTIQNSRIPTCMQYSKRKKKNATFQDYSHIIIDMPMLTISFLLVQTPGDKRNKPKDNKNQQDPNRRHIPCKSSNGHKMRLWHMRDKMVLSNQRTPGKSNHVPKRTHHT